MLRTPGLGAVQCETEIEQLERMALPSLGRFDAKARQCMDDFGVRCVGPARASAEARLAHAHERERARFQQDYNNRLYNGLVGLALAAAVLCRFIFKAAVPELIGWGVFIFLEVRRLPPSRTSRHRRSRNLPPHTRRSGELCC